MGKIETEELFSNEIGDCIPIIESKAHFIPDDNSSHDQFSAHITVGADGITESNGGRNGV